MGILLSYDIRTGIHIDIRIDIGIGIEIRSLLPYKLRPSIYKIRLPFFLVYSMKTLSFSSNRL